MNDSVIPRVLQRSIHLLKLIEICAGDSELVTTESSEIFQPVSRKLRGPCLYGKFSPRRGGGHESIIQAYYSRGLYFFEPCGKFHNKLPGTRSFRCAGLNNSPGGLKRTVPCATSRNIRASFVYTTETTAIFKTPVSSTNILKLRRLNK